MGKAVSLLFKGPAFWSYRLLGGPKLLPVNYTFSLTRRCNSRCKTCRIWDHPAEWEMSWEEWRRVIDSLGRAPIWITLSGGEPFLVDWIDKAVLEIVEVNRPELVVIPTNALLPDVIEAKLREILPKIAGRLPQLTINVSVDGIGEKHDEIRGIPGNFSRVERTVEILKGLKRGYPFLSLGIHTVVSRWNVGELEEIIEFVAERFSPDQHIFEVAEVRGEMNNDEDSPMPSREGFRSFVRALSKLHVDEEGSWINRVIRLFRKRYYSLLERVLYDGVQPLSSFAGFATVQINSNGDVWDCAVHTNVMGNLKDYGFDFKRFWRYSSGVKEVQERVKRSHLCPLANEMYINLLLSPWRLVG